jgi:uncharacterized protein (TIGR03437 family)
MKRAISLAVLGVLWGLAAAARAETLTAIVPLTPADVVPPVSGSNARGTGVITVDFIRDAAGNITSANFNFEVDFTFPDRVEVEGLNFCLAESGQHMVECLLPLGLRPIIFTTGKGKINLTGVSIDAPKLRVLLAHPARFGLQLNTTANHLGAMRGQVGRWLEIVGSKVRLDEQNVVPPTGDRNLGRFTAAVTVTATRNIAGRITGGSLSLAMEFIYLVVVGEIPRDDEIIGVRIYEGAAGTNGPMRLDAGYSRSNPLRGIIGQVFVTFANLDPAMLQRLVDNPAGFYVQVETTNQPNGHKRAQLTAFAKPPNIVRLSEYLVSAGPINTFESITITAEGANQSSNVKLNGGGGGVAAYDSITGQFVMSAYIGSPGNRIFRVIDATTELESVPRSVVIADPDKINRVAVTTVDAARFGAELAPESLAAAFGTQLATQTVAASTRPLPTTLGGTSVYVNGLPAPLFYVSPTQINFQIPSDVHFETAEVVIVTQEGAVSSGVIKVATTAPGIFTVTANGAGAPAAVASADGVNFNIAVANPDGTPRPLDAGVYVSLFGTGLRFAPNADLNDQNGVGESVGITLGGINVAPLFAGAQGSFDGLDQINFRIPESLAGRGVVDLVVSVAGRTANTVKLQIK